MVAPACPKQNYNAAISLGDGISMFLPNNLTFTQQNQTFNLFIQFRGVVPQRFAEAGVQTIIVACETAGLSEAMLKKFGFAAFVPQVVQQVTVAVQQRIGVVAKLNRLGLGSFSAGYAPLREHLNVEQVVNLLDAVIVIDGIHYGPPKHPNATMLAPFVMFAKQAATYEKLMVVSHSSIVPPYCSSTDAANYLIEQVHAVRINVSSVPGNYTYPTRFGHVLKPETRADMGTFHVEGYTGDQANDHVEQIDNLGNLWNFYLAKRWQSC